MMTPQRKRWWLKQFEALEVYDDWRDFEWQKQRWANFSPWEFYSKGDGKLAIDEYALDCLQALRTEIGKPIQINSAFRSVAYNRRIGGSKWSMHKLAIAFDINLHGHDRKDLTEAAIANGFNGIGQYRTFIHIDTRPWIARWDQRWRGK